MTDRVLTTGEVLMRSLSLTFVDLYTTTLDNRVNHIPTDELWVLLKF